MPWLMNFQPKTGVGRFDLGLIGENLFVRMKVNIGMGLAGGEQTTWNNKFEPLIKAHWENRFGFCKNGVTLKPEFFIEYTDDMHDAHFVVNVMPGAGGSESVGRDAYYKLKDEDGFLPTTANLAQGSVEATDSSSLTVSGLQSSFPFYVDTRGGAISSYSKTQLHMVARQLKQIDSNAKVQVTAYGNNKTASRGHVKTVLRQCGLGNVHTRHSKKVFGSKNPHSNEKDYCKINLASGLGMIDASSSPLFSYPAAAVHEFGHMLGLQDEYMCMSKTCSDKLAELNFIEPHEQAFYESFKTPTASPVSDRPGQGQMEMVLYCQAAGVVPPHFGRHSVSIMSSGSKFLPCHFVTIWAALEKLTTAHNGKWEIVKLDRTVN